MGLFDESKPAGAIVEVFQDGDAMRNDGVRLTAARKNRWYVLATVAGEQSDDWIDPRVARSNRRYWNGFFSQKLSKSEKENLAKSMGLDVSEFAPLTDSEWRTLITRMSLAFPDDFNNSSMSSDFENFIYQYVDFYKVYFRNHCDFSQYYFRNFTNFEKSFICNFSSFEKAHFEKAVCFDCAHFENNALFMACEFLDDVTFNSAHLGNDRATFSGAIFRGNTFFIESKFFSDVDFCDAQFFKEANFASSEFKGNLALLDGCFKNKTSFIKTSFTSRVPTFYQRDMHQDTTFTEDPAYWPAPTPDNAQHGKQAYTRLRQIAASNQNPDLEHFFLRQEMACKEVLDCSSRKYIYYCTSKAFGFFADYGNSFTRPLFALGYIFALGWAIIGSYLNYLAGCQMSCSAFCEGVLAELGNPEISSNPIGDGFVISMGNTLPFIDISNKMHEDFFKHAPWWLDLLSAIQSIFGIILIFFIALGLRNRFRLK
jgi:uncharacterized protein YjbI with pentapeptide repeats